MGQGFPSFAIFTLEDGEFSKPSKLSGVYNSKTYFDYGFRLSNEDNSDSRTAIEAIPCKDAIPKYVTGEVEQTLILDNYGPSIDNFICPDFDSVELNQQSWMEFDISRFSTLSIYVRVKDLYEEKAQSTQVMVSWNYPYYDATEYRSNGGNLLWTN